MCAALHGLHLAGSGRQRGGRAGLVALYCVQLVGHTCECLPPHQQQQPQPGLTRIYSVARSVTCRGCGQRLEVGGGPAPAPRQQRAGLSALLVQSLIHPRLRFLFRLQRAATRKINDSVAVAAPRRAPLNMGSLLYDDSMCCKWPVAA